MTSSIGDITPTMYSGTVGGTDSSASTGSSSDSTDIGGLNSDTFLQLLVSQLTNQDPMNPTDSSTYITEEAEFSMVQSMNNVASQNAKILQSQQMQEASSFIGKNVTYVDSTGAQAVGVVSSASPGDSTTGAVVRVGNDQIPVTSITSVFADTSMS